MLLLISIPLYLCPCYVYCSIVLSFFWVTYLYTHQSLNPVFSNVFTLSQVCVRVSTVTCKFQHCFRTFPMDLRSKTTFFSFEPNSSMEHVPVALAGLMNSSSWNTTRLQCTLRKKSRFCAVDEQFLENATLLNALWSKPEFSGVCVGFGCEQVS